MTEQGTNGADTLLSPAHIPLHLAGVGPMGVLAALVWPESSARAVSPLGYITALSTSTDLMRT